MARARGQNQDPLRHLPTGRWTRLHKGLPDVPLLVGSKTATGAIRPPAVPAVVHGSSLSVSELSPDIGVQSAVTVPQTRSTVYRDRETVPAA